MPLKEDFIQLKAFARIDGLILAVVWICSFAAVLFIPQSQIGLFLSISTPFVVGNRVLHFRNTILEGLISFRRAFAYSIYIFLYASLLFAVAQFAYFSLIDNGQFASMLLSTEEPTAQLYAQWGVPASEIHNAIASFLALKPIELVLLFMFQNIFIGLILSFFIALLCAKSKPIRQFGH